MNIKRMKLLLSIAFVQYICRSKVTPAGEVSSDQLKIKYVCMINFSFEKHTYHFFLNRNRIKINQS
jgi:hypothetical protein